jgi:two-component system, cell cycle sensor histidine kinase and response regulator CckA
MSDTPIPAAFDRAERAGSPGLLLALAIALLAAAFSYKVVPQSEATRLTLGLLAFLAVIGVVSLFAYAVGFLQFSGQAARNDITKAISDSSSDGVLATEDESRIIYANESYMAISGARDAADIRTVDRLFSGAPEVSEAVYRLAQAAREGKRGSEEIRMTPPLSGDGQVGWYRILVRPLGRAGHKRATLWIVSDITRERARHENVFQELKHAIDFLDHAPAGFLSAEADGSIPYMNATLASWLDYDLAQVGSGGATLADVMAGDSAALLTLVSGGRGEVKTEQFDVDLRRRDGQNLPVRILHRVAFGSDGAPGPSRTLVINRAAGEEKAETLRAAEVRFARFFNQTPMAIAAVDRDGRTIRANAAFVRLRRDALGANDDARSIYSGVVEREREAVRDAIAQAAQGKTDIAPIDLTLAGEGDRTARFFVCSAEEDTDQVCAHIFAMDTTEQRTLEHNFNQSQKMQAIGQLAGGVAHDFNNVLTAIIGYSDLLLANHRPTDPSFQDIMQIRQNANRAAGLVRQLLAFSRRQTLRPQVMQLGEVLSDLQMLLRRLVGEKVELEVRHGRDLWLVKADLNQFEQVIVNLVVNSRDAMPEGGRILVKTRNVGADEISQFGEKSLAPADYVMTEVEDTGHGIPEAIRDKVFEPFFTTKEVGKGTGLGLSMVYGIVKQTGGWVFCDSQVGIGTTFRILLPRHIPSDKPEEEETAKEETKAPAPDLTGRGTILLVEDEDAVRAFGARALASRGYTVLEACSGADALRVVEEAGELIDLVVSDVVMPEMDGPTMFGELRKRGVKCKGGFVSGYAEDAFAKNLPDGEDFGFLPKPFTLKQLVEAVKSSLA